MLHVPTCSCIIYRCYPPNHFFYASSSSLPPSRRWYHRCLQHWSLPGECTAWMDSKILIRKFYVPELCCSHFTKKVWDAITIVVSNYRFNRSEKYLQKTAHVCESWKKCYLSFLASFGSNFKRGYCKHSPMVAINFMLRHIEDILSPGGRINVKMSSYQYRKSHCGDKTILRPSYLHNGISYTDKMTSLYWIRALNEMAAILQATF